MVNGHRPEFNHQNQNEPADLHIRNPYARFRFCCTNLHIKDHAQLCGVISFSLFLCLVVISLMLFGALSIFYIVIGIIVYTLLMKSLFGCDDKMYVLFYLLFEAIQIGFNLALALYVALPLLFYRLPKRQHCVPIERLINNGTMVEKTHLCKEIVPSSGEVEEYMELLLFILLLVSVKLYFARVFAHFYKFLVWSEKILIHSAQYVNGRGVQISALNHLFPPPPPSFWDNSVVRDQGYGYDQQQIGDTQIGGLGNFADLPSYAQAIGQQEQKLSPAQIEEGQVVDVENEETEMNGQRLNLHV